MARSEVIVSRGELPEWTIAEFSGSGYGYGYGDGSGYGSGYGYGSGDGSGYGYGKESYAALFHAQKQTWSSEEKQRLSIAEVEASVLAFWKSSAKGLPANGGAATEAARPGKLEEIVGPLEICTARALHATMNPDAWKGDRLWVVALYGDVVWDGDKCGALKREILGEIIL